MLPPRVPPKKARSPIMVNKSRIPTMNIPSSIERFDLVLEHNGKTIPIINLSVKNAAGLITVNRSSFSINMISTTIGKGIPILALAKVAAKIRGIIHHFIRTLSVTSSFTKYSTKIKETLVCDLVPIDTHVGMFVSPDSFVLFNTPFCSLAS